MMITNIHENDVAYAEMIYANSYGVISVKAMRDKSLDIEAKGLYAYFCSMAKARDVIFPSIDFILEDLNIGINRYRKYKKQLEELNYIRVNSIRGGNGENLYHVELRGGNS